MNDEAYVRKDMFEETIKRIEAVHEASLKEIRAMNAAAEARTAAQIAEIRAEVKVYRTDSRRESESLASDIKAIKDSLSDMKSWQGVLGFVITFSAIIIAAVQVYLALK